MKDWIDAAAKAVALLTFAAICLSVVYELGFYIEFDPALQSFMTPADYLSNAVQWLPWALLILLASSVAAVLTIAPLLYKVFVEDGSPSEGGSSSKLLGFLLSPWTVLLFQIVFFAGLYLFKNVDRLHPFLGLALFTSCVSWLLLWVNQWSVYQAVFSTMRSRMVVATLVTQIPGTIGFVFVWGTIDAISVIDGPGQTYIIERKGDVSLSRQTMHNLGAGLLVRDSNSGQIALLKWDEIRSITTTPQPLERRSPFCRVTGLWCQPFKKSEPGIILSPSAR